MDGQWETLRFVLQTQPVFQNGPAHANILINTFISYQFSLIFGRSSNHFDIKYGTTSLIFTFLRNLICGPLRQGTLTEAEGSVRLTSSLR
jgi:hypothetical protein